MVVNTTTYEPKIGKGVGLKPSLWNRIDRYAEAQGKSRAQVIEEVLNTHIPVDRKFENPQESPTDSQPITLKEVPDDDD